jgi:hypothetical protein
VTGPTEEEFDELLLSIVKEETAESLARVPGLYEALADHFHDEVLELWASAREDDAISRERFL